MQRVTLWLKEYAMTQGGITPDDATRFGRQITLPQNMQKKLSEAGILPRIEAMSQLGAYYSVMDGRAFQEAMTSAHFSYYFADALSRAFYDDYAYQQGQWQAYVHADTAPDFREVDRFRMTEPGGLNKRREKAESKTTHIAESKISYQVDEFSRQFDVPWRVILNDDLGKIRETPNRMAKAARRWLDQFVNNLYDNAVTRATLIALGPPWSGTGRLTPANLAVGVNAMVSRPDALGNPMNMPRIHLVIPPVLQIQAGDILQDLLSYGGPGGNTLGQYIAGVHTDPYITVAGANVPWYLFAAPDDVPAVTLLRLQGWPGPITAMKRSNIEMFTGVAPSAFLMGSFETGDIEFMVEDVVGGWDDASYVGVTDFRGIYFSNGTTP